jgi:hypothetical protein
MFANPYAPPESDSTGKPDSSGSRGIARRCLRIASLILLAPAVYNFICFSYSADQAPFELRIQNLYRLINGCGIFSTSVVIWFLGLTLLEFLTIGIHMFFGRNSSIEAWKAALYQILGRAPLFALLGAMLWAFWVAAFYQLGVGFHAISVPIGIAAHLLAAGLYIPLIASWYKLERSNL